jgi:hypothetical protein
MTVIEVYGTGHARCEYAKAGNDKRPPLCAIVRIDHLVRIEPQISN